MNSTFRAEVLDVRAKKANSPQICWDRNARKQENTVYRLYFGMQTCLKYLLREVLSKILNRLALNYSFAQCAADHSITTNLRSISILKIKFNSGYSALKIRF